MSQIMKDFLGAGEEHPRQSRHHAPVTCVCLASVMCQARSLLSWCSNRYAKEGCVREQGMLRGL